MVAIIRQQVVPQDVALLVKLTIMMFFLLINAFLCMGRAFNLFLRFQPEKPG